MATVETNPPPVHVAGAPHPQTHKGLIIFAVMLTTALSALDANIVGTAIPSIVGALRGIGLLPWLVTAFMLTSTVSVPLYGKLADLYGRKPVLLAGVTLFLAGSALCGVAGSMEQLIAFRALQGLGAGSVVPVTLTLIGDLFEMEERARLQGLFSAVWGVSSVLGPLVGGFIVTVWSWPWVFLVNVPVGILAMGILAVYLREPVRSRTRRPSLDLLGAATLTGGLTAALTALSLVSNGAGWGSPSVLGLLGLALALLVAFVVVERRAAEPLIPLDLLTAPITRVSIAAGLFSSGLVFGGGAYLPILVQGVWQGSPLEAGLALAPLSIGWPLASTVAGRAILRWGYRPVALVGAVLIAVGGLLLLPLGPGGPIWLLPAAMFVQGLGCGFNFTTMLMAVQNAASWERRGAATSLYQFSRNIGGVIAVAVLGYALSTALAGALAQIPALPGVPAAAAGGSQLGPASVLLDLNARTHLAPATLATLEAALADGLRPVLWIAAFLGLGTGLATWFFPAERIPTRAAPAEEPALPGA
jgi:EmrB/QacA subfamily drug resistance transporter